MVGAIFRGEGDLMVDALVTACAQQKAPAQPGPLKERQLTPFFVEGCGANPGLGDVNVTLAVKPERRSSASRDSRGREDVDRPSSVPSGAASASPPQSRNRGRHNKGQQEAQTDLSSSPPASQRTLRLVQQPVDGGSVLGRRSASEPTPPPPASGRRPASASKASSSTPPRQSAAAAAAPKGAGAKAPLPPSGGQGAQQPQRPLWAGPGFSKAPDPAALPLPSFGRCQSESAVPALARTAAPSLVHQQPLPDSADASEQLRRMLSICAPPAPAPAAPVPAPGVAAQHSMALRQLLGVAAC